MLVAAFWLDGRHLRYRFTLFSCVGMDNLNQWIDDRQSFERARHQQKKKALAKVHWDVSCQYIGFRSTTSTFLGTSQRGTDIVPRVCGFVDCVTHSPTGIFIFDAQDLVLIKPKQHNQKLQRLVLCTSRKSVLIAFAADLHTNKPWQGQHKFWSTSRRRASLAGK